MSTDTRIDTRVRTRHVHAAGVGAAGLLCLTTVLLSAVPARASRLPADPIAFAPTPTLVAQLVHDSQAAHVRAALADVLSDHSGPSDH